MSYRKLEIWQRAREIVIDIHKMTLKELPKFEIYESLHARLQTLGKKINRFIQSVEKGHKA